MAKNDWASHLNAFAHNNMLMSQSVALVFKSHLKAANGRQHNDAPLEKRSNTLEGL